MTDILKDPYVVGLLKYTGTILVGALAAGLGVLMAQLAGTDPITWRPVLAAALGPIVTGLMARQLTKGGREEIGALVTRIGTTKAKRALEVEATKQVVGAVETPSLHPDMTPVQTDQLLTLIQRVGPVEAIAALNKAAYSEPLIDPTTPQGRAAMDEFSRQGRERAAMDDERQADQEAVTGTPPLPPARKG